MIRSSIYYTFLNKTTKSGHVSSSGIHGVQKYYRINKLKKYIPGTNSSLLVRCDVLYLPPSKWKLVNISCRCSTYVWRSRKHCGHGNETMRSLCIDYVLWLLTILKASPKTASGSSKQAWHIPDAVCVCVQFLSSWWWAEKPPETCRALTIIKNIV